MFPASFANPALAPFRCAAIENLREMIVADKPITSDNPALC